MSTLTDNLKKTLDNLGSTVRTRLLSNGLLDLSAHEFVLSQFMRSYSEKRYDKAKKKLVSVLGTDIEDRVKETKTSVARREVSSTIELAEGEHYSVNALVNLGATYLDEASLFLELSTHVDHAELKRMFEKHRKRYACTVTYIVTEKV